jgi:hypothetical protein
MRLVMGVSWKTAALIAIAFWQVGHGEVPVATSSDTEEYSGCLTWGFEDAYFLPIAGGGKVQWWIAAVPNDFPAWLNTVPAQSGYRTMFARVIATLGASGRYGHSGMGSREIKISEVLELRQFEESDGMCGVPPPPVPHPDSFLDPSL